MGATHALGRIVRVNVPSRRGRPVRRDTSVISPNTRTPRFLAALLAASFATGWWSVMARLADRWSEPDGSHGWLVAGLAAALAWRGRQEILDARRLPHRAGVGLILLGVAVRLTGTWFGIEPLMSLSIVPALAGVVSIALDLLKADAAVVATQPAKCPVEPRRNLPAVMALPFGLVVVALPLPWSVETEITGWLQHVSTSVAVFGLQVLGEPVFASGNVLQSGPVRVGVAEACSGLHLLSTQIVLTVVIAFWTARPRWQRAVLVACSPLVAVGTNAIRLAGMVLAHRHLATVSVAVVHDILGWLMAPLALAAVGLEIQLLRWIAPEASPANGLAGGASSSATVSAFVSGRSTWNAT